MLIIWQKLIQYCEAIILQLKINTFKLKKRGDKNNVKNSRDDITIDTKKVIFKRKKYSIQRFSNNLNVYTKKKENELTNTDF